MKDRDELVRRRQERERDDRRRERRLLVFAGVAFVVAIIVGLTLRFVVDAFGQTVAEAPEGGVVIDAPDATALALDRSRARNAQLERRVRRLTRRVRRQRRNFRYALHASPIGSHWLEVAFLCVYSYERGRDGWATNTGNGYDGGLQMDDSFQEAHGADFLKAFGPAWRWPRSVQVAVAIDAWTTRGFQPWPRTARECGLL